jgi:anti-anti-sigma factor
MEVATRRAGDVTVLTLKGRLVLEDVEAQLRGVLDGLIEQGRVNLVLNLRDVNYVDSAGVGYLVSKYVSLHRRGGDLKLVQPAPRVAHVLDITRLARVFRSFDSDDDAVRDFERASHQDSPHVPASSSGGQATR